MKVLKRIYNGIGRHPTKTGNLIMYYKEHLVVSGIVNGIFLFGLYKLSSFNILESELLWVLIITFYIFSILPDIDHPGSHISGILYLFLIYVFGSSVYYFYKTLNWIYIPRIISAAGVFIIHVKYAEDSYLHRRFPHTFTFGIIACIVLYFLVGSLLVTTIGAVSFFTHILSDGHLDEAVERDKELLVEIGLKIKSYI